MTRTLLITALSFLLDMAALAYALAQSPPTAPQKQQQFSPPTKLSPSTQHGSRQVPAPSTTRHDHSNPQHHQPPHSGPIYRPPQHRPTPPMYYPPRYPQYRAPYYSYYQPYGYPRPRYVPPSGYWSWDSVQRRWVWRQRGYRGI